MLTHAQIGQLSGALTAACDFITDLRRSVPMAAHVQYPKIPSILSESIAAQAIKEGRLLASAGPFVSVVFGGRVADILATSRQGTTLRIETKASGPQEFATFGPKDYGADYLLWMLFGDIFRTGSTRRLEVLVMERPGVNLTIRNNRVTVNQLRNAWAGPLPSESIDLPALE